MKQNLLRHYSQLLSPLKNPILFCQGHILQLANRSTAISEWVEARGDTSTCGTARPALRVLDGARAAAGPAPPHSAEVQATRGAVQVLDRLPVHGNMVCFIFLHNSVWRKTTRPKWCVNITWNCRILRRFREPTLNLKYYQWDETISPFTRCWDRFCKCTLVNSNVLSMYDINNYINVTSYIL